jgi:cytochrome c peroxidase
MHNTGAGADAARLLPSQRVAHRDEHATIDFASAGDRGRHEVTQVAGDLGRFRTPTLRNVALTSPYMHDGSLATLRDVVRFYNAGGGANPNLDSEIKPLGLTEAEVADLIAFLESLTGGNAGDLAREAQQAQDALSAVSP